MIATKALLKKLKVWTSVEVLWEDAHTHNGAVSEEFIKEWDKRCMRLSIGYIAFADKEHICIASTDDREADSGSLVLCDILTVPMSLVRDIVFLKAE